MGNSIYWQAVCHHPQDKATVIHLLAEVRAPKTESTLTLGVSVSEKGKKADRVPENRTASAQVLGNENPQGCAELTQKLGFSPAVFSR